MSVGADMGVVVGRVEGAWVGIGVGPVDGDGVGGYTRILAWNAHWLGRGLQAETSTSFVMQWLMLNDTPVQWGSSVH